MPLIEIGIDLNVLAMGMLAAWLGTLAAMLLAVPLGGEAALGQVLWCYVVVSSAAVAAAALDAVLEPRPVLLKLLVLTRPCEVISLQGSVPGRYVALLEGTGPHGGGLIYVKVTRTACCYGDGIVWVCARRTPRAVACLSRAVAEALMIDRFEVLRVEDRDGAREAIELLAAAIELRRL